MNIAETSEIRTVSAADYNNTKYKKNLVSYIIIASIYGRLVLADGPHFGRAFRTVSSGIMLRQRRQRRRE